MKTTKLLLCVAAVAATCSLARVHAQNIEVQLIGVNPGINGVSTSYDGTNFQSQDIGILVFDIGPAFCVDPTATMNFPDTLIYSVTDPSTLEANDIIAKLIGGYVASNGSALNAAAVQLAIWEVLGDNSTTGSLTSGNIQIRNEGSAQPVNDLIALAHDYLANVDSYQAVNLTYLVHTGVGDDHRQNVVTWEVVPEPSSVLLLGLSTLALFRRKR
jgi:hypothetical protein